MAGFTRLNNISGTRTRIRTKNPAEIKLVTVIQKTDSESNIGIAAKRLYQLLDQHVIVGEDTIVFVEDYQEKVIEVDEAERNLLNEFDHYMQKLDFFKSKRSFKAVVAGMGG
ncbi:MAG: hypothetical protein E7247_14090 [Paenibacillaceae bacterium]|nr:hypothetical protein [Paenibacillaceae bacterium]